MGAGRFELYSEPPDEGAPSGRFHRLQERWREAVHGARKRADEAGEAGRAGEAGEARTAVAGCYARVRDWAIRRTAEMIAEQRTLWSLRHATAATLVHASDLTASAAGGIRDRLAGHARRHHGWWLLVDTLLLAVSGVFAIVPGPNALAYYFALRVVGHYLSWRGACQALDGTNWQLRAEPALTELGQLADAPREARASRVDAIANGLNVPRLAVFFDRAAPARR